MTEHTAVVHLVREALEGVVTPEIAAAVLFEALGAAPEVPRDRVSVIRFAQGALKEALVRRIGASDAQEVVGRILMPLESATRPDTRKRRDDAPTRAVPTTAHAVPVAILAGSTGLAIRLSAALGPQRIDVRSSPSALEIGSPPGAAPAVVIVDASDFPPIDPVHAELGLRPLPPTTARVVYCAELAYGQRCVEAFVAADQHPLALRTSDGIDPLLDLVRSRRSP